MGGDDMTDATAAIWVAGITCWLMIGIPTTYFMLTSTELETVQVRNYISPGAACVLMLTKVQREMLACWIDAEDEAPRPLQSFRRQLMHAKKVNGVPVYRGQVVAVSELVERRGLKELAEELRRR